MDILEKNINILAKYIIAIEIINFQLGRQFIEFLTNENILNRETFDDYRDAFDSMLNLEEKINGEQNDYRLKSNSHNKTKNSNSYIIFETVIFLQNEKSWNKKGLENLQSTDIKQMISSLIKEFINEKKIKPRYKDKIEALLDNYHKLEEWTSDDKMVDKNKPHIK